MNPVKGRVLIIMVDHKVLPCTRNYSIVHTNCNCNPHLHTVSSKPLQKYSGTTLSRSRKVLKF